MIMIHIPILVSEILACLEGPLQDKNTLHIDATLGFGGHFSKLVSCAHPQKPFLALDRDADSIDYCKTQFSSYASSFVHAPFSSLSNYTKPFTQQGIKLGSLLVDLGFSSYQLDTVKRGFSYLYDGPIDMRMNTADAVDAAHILNTYDAGQLEAVFTNNADLPSFEKLIKTIINYRASQPLTHTDQLVYIIKKSFYFKNSRRRFLNTCAQVFQALRIEVNQELAELESLLNFLDQHLMIGGRVCILSFHSIEDRLVKRFFSKRKKEFQLINNRVLKASQIEIKANTRAKAAKLRAYERVVL